MVFVGSGRNQFSAMIGLRKTPIPSPGFVQRGGFCTKPTPSGLPVEITSPALSGVHHSHENHREEWFF